MRMLLAVLVLLPLLGAGCAASQDAAHDPDRPPNIVVVFADDLGYGDVGVYGAEGYATPHLDRLAAGGMRFTDFHAAEPVCTASRVALLTGAYAQRVGLGGALGPGSRVGIADGEVLLSELLKARGYATAIFGKWHLGDRPPFLPTRHGFDAFYGLPYSNDMWPYHPNPAQAASYPPLPLMEGEAVVELNPDQSTLTRDLTRRAVAFIEAHQDEPFFLYLPHPMPHVPLFASDAFRGTTDRGLFGDVITEIDASVGAVMEALRRNGLERNTLVVFTSDNGPWLAYGDHAGSAGPLREGKHTSWEGGHREPAIFWWPGRIPAGAVSDAFASTLDLFPTVAALVDAPLPEHPIDGHDLGPILFGDPDAPSPWGSFYHYRAGRLEAVRSGPWKLVLPHAYVDVAVPGVDGQPGETTQTPIPLALYHLGNDLAETTDVADRHPDVVERLLALAEDARAELGDRLTDRSGAAVRTPGRVEEETGR